MTSTNTNISRTNINLVMERMKTLKRLYEKQKEKNKMMLARCRNAKKYQESTFMLLNKLTNIYTMLDTNENPEQIKDFITKTIKEFKINGNK